MSNLPLFVYLKLPGATFILHTKEPFIVGRVWMYKDLYQIQEQIRKIDPLAVAFIVDYNMAISLYTALNGRITLHKKNDLQIVIDAMAVFYYEDKVKGIKYFNQYLTQ